VSWESTQTKQGSRPFDSNTVNFLKRLLITFFMAISWVILALCIRLSPASGADYPVADRLSAGERFDGYGTTEAVQAVPYPFMEHPDSRDISISIGKTAFENGDYDSAVEAFDQALADRPDPSIEGLASESGSSVSSPQGAARQHLEEALSFNPHQEVQSTINKNLRVIKSSKKEHFLSAKISLGLDLNDDDPAHAGANIGTTASLNDAVTVTVDRPQKGQKHTSTASFDYLYRPRGSSVSWKLSGMNYVAVYRDNKDLNVNLYDFKAGTSIYRNKLTWDIYGATNNLTCGFGQYLRTYGTGTTVNYAFTSFFRLSVDGKIKMKNYFEDDNMDARNMSLAVSPKFALGRNRISLSVGLEQEDARDEINSYTKIIGNATYEVILPFASSAYVSYRYQGTEYKSLSDTSRMDEVRYISTGLTKSLPVWESTSGKVKMDLNLNYSYTRADPNIDLYAYTKKILTSGMSVMF